MSTLYVILGIVVAMVISTVIMVIIKAVDHNKKVNVNWLLLMATIAVSAILCMVLIYHNQHDLTQQDIQQSYDNGYEDGVAAEHHTIPTNEEMENWFSSTEEVVVGTNGTDTAVHIIDHNGDEWVLYADNIQTK